MPRGLKKLSFKERGFTKDYIETKGNATEACVRNYNVSSRKFATLFGWRMLQKPKIRNEIERLMEEKEITDGVMIKKLKEGMDANVVVQYQGEAFVSDIPDHDKRFKWWEAGAKMKNFFPPQETINKNLNIDLQLETMSKEEFVGLLKGLLSEAKKEKEKCL